MGPTEKPASATTALDPALLVSDPELVETLLLAFQELELPEQLQLLVERTAGWAGAGSGLALAAGQERRALSPVASTMPREDPRLAAFGRIDPERVKRWLPEGARLFPGLGPFAEVIGPWPEAPPAALAALPVRSTEGALAAVILLLLDRPLGALGLERIGRLLELSRPAVANALKVRAMRELVIKDDTAHCFNRRHFETCLPEEISRAGRFNTPLSLIFLDMDNLKEVNRQHGHAMGSRTLCEVSRRIRAKIRRFDKLFRFGGDEFCIVLPETEWHGALEVAERVRDAIARQPFLIGEVADPGGVRMTASLGIASFPLHARSQRDLIEHADRAMQRIKNGTKNSIGIAEIRGEDDGR